MANHDPYPFSRFPDGNAGPRYRSNEAGFLYLNPRPYYETKDPEPWMDSVTKARFMRQNYLTMAYWWAPRRGEYDGEQAES